jgi:hypothetical protein
VETDVRPPRGRAVGTIERNPCRPAVERGPFRGRFTRGDSGCIDLILTIRGAHEWLSPDAVQARSASLQFQPGVPSKPDSHSGCGHAGLMPGPVRQLPRGAPLRSFPLNRVSMAVRERRPSFNVRSRCAHSALSAGMSSMQLLLSEAL